MAEKEESPHLSQQQIEAIKQQILASIYEDIGRSIVKKVLWLAGVVGLALLAWLASIGKIQVTH